LEVTGIINKRGKIMSLRRFNKKGAFMLAGGAACALAMLMGTGVSGHEAANGIENSSKAA
jgi:hypothetical protein